MPRKYCPRCGGTGELLVTGSKMTGRLDSTLFVPTKRCPRCRGRGYDRR